MRYKARDVLEELELEDRMGIVMLSAPGAVNMECARSFRSCGLRTGFELKSFRTITSAPPGSVGLTLSAIGLRPAHGNETTQASGAVAKCSIATRVA